MSAVVKLSLANFDDFVIGVDDIDHAFLALNSPVVCDTLNERPSFTRRINKPSRDAIF